MQTMPASFYHGLLAMLFIASIPNTQIGCHSPGPPINQTPHEPEQPAHGSSQQQGQQQTAAQMKTLQELQTIKSLNSDEQMSQMRKSPSHPPIASEFEIQSIARLLVERFRFLLSQDELVHFEQQDALVRGQFLLDRLNWQSSVGSKMMQQQDLQQNQQLTQAQQQQPPQQHQQSSLETRTLGLIQSNLSKLTSINLNELSQQQQKRNFIRVLNRVFSRVELPEAFNANRAGLSRASQVGVPSAASIGSAAAGNQNAANQYCAAHIGCIAEIPNMPVMFKLKSNVSASFTIYTREKGPKNGQRVLYEPLMHYQLRDSAEQTMSELALQKEVLNITRSLKLAATHHHHHHHKRRNPVLLPGTGASQLGKQQAGKLLSTVATSWISANKIAQSRELPFDLAALEQSGFNASLNTRIIIGGYFAKEDEEWIDELVRQWLLLENSNVIKVSWQDSNRGLYHSAAHNSRIVGRQLSLFLHYLDELFQIDLNKFHLVGHSLGAHIAGFVGADNEGQIARITGLDPAGPIFVELGQAHRLDASDAKFVDVLHTNGGTITKGALGLSTPSGHVDYYCNGGSLQPGCFFSSVTMSTIMDPVERIACNHRRSYRYFTEIIKLAIKERRRLARAEPLAASAISDDADQLMANSSSFSRRFPHAFLFETNKLEELVKLVQPQLKLSQLSLLAQAGGGATAEPSQPPLRKQIEFHQMDPDFPRDKRGLYFFRTRQELPFFVSKQYALRLGLDQPLKRKVTLLVKINSTLVAEVELDELERSHSLVFVPNNPEAIDHGAIFSGRSSKAPDLWLMWRQRSFNLLLAHGSANEIHLNALELSLLDENEQLDRAESLSSNDSPPATTRLMRQKLGLNDYMIRYEPNGASQVPDRQLQQQQQLQSGNAADNARSADQTTSGLARVAVAAQSQPPAASQSFVITRNQWHKFDGRPVAIE